MQRNGHVRVLPIHVANKIAAGEVVERPASVVKELVENSIDAGAKNIKITIAKGGRKAIAVQDDGFGMDNDDALLCLERQATSKILDVDDIEKIDTLGFRGEAIPSIASVSRFTLTTRRHTNDEGFYVQVNAGSLDASGAAGCPPGTKVEVKDLFCNVPARRKFLKSDITEESHIKHIFTVAALANPNIAFSLNVDGRDTHTLASSNALEDRIRDIFGRDFFENLIELKTTASINGVSVKGYIEKPNLSIPTRREQYIFINGRAASAPAIAYALREAYPRKQGDVKPAAIIFITLPPTQVDVNVHPMKREVRFRDNTSVKAAIIAALDNAFKIQQQVILPEAKPSQTDVPLQASTRTITTNNGSNKTYFEGATPTTPSINSVIVENAKLDEPSVFITKKQKENIDLTEAPSQIEFAIDPNSTQTGPWKWYNFLAITNSGYLLVETDAGIVTINPRAACERIAYEKLLATQQGDNISQPLLIPETVKLPPSDFARIKNYLSQITALGFSLDEFGNDTYKVDAIPHLLDETPISAVLLTLAKDLSEAGAKRGGEKWREELIAKSIAKTYSGSRQQLTRNAAEQLIKDLAACRMPYICPRGRVTMIFTSMRELDRKFSKD